MWAMPKRAHLPTRSENSATPERSPMPPRWLARAAGGLMLFGSLASFACAEGDADPASGDGRSGAGAAIGEGSAAPSMESAEAAAAGAAGEEQGDPARDAWGVPDAMGDVYAANCAVCHGAALEGSALGSALNGPALVHGDSVDAVVASISQGFGAKMPGWAAALPAADSRGLAI